MSPGGTPLSTSSTSGVDEHKNGVQTGPALYQMIRNGRAFSGHERNCCFLNIGNEKFADVSSVSGFDFPDDGRAVALCDWDLDGDLDVWTANRTGPQVRILRNDLQTRNHYLSLQLQGKTCNRDAIGARVEVILARGPNEPEQRLIKTLRAGEGFLAQSSKWVHFGLGSAESIQAVVVHWPGGEKEQFDDVQCDQRYHIVEGSGKPELWKPPTILEQRLQPSELPQPGATSQARVVPANPIPLPPLEYTTLNGESRLFEPSKQDQPVLINLWASWCHPCVKELKEWDEDKNKISNAGVKIIALSVDRLDHDRPDSTSSANELLKRIGYNGDAGWATDALVEKVRLVRQHLFELHVPMTVPTSLLIDSEGRLVVLYRGRVSVDQLLDDVARLPELESGPTALPFKGRWHTRRGLLKPVDIAWRLVDHGYLDDSIGYIAKNDSLLNDSPYLHRLLLRVANKLLARGDAKLAISYYRRAMSLKDNYRNAQNNLAWVLATHPDDSLRDGKEAMRLIEAAMKQSPPDAFTLLDTLAAAYAETGQFEKAAETAKRAIDFANAAGQNEFAKMLDLRLRRYQSNEPYRE